MNLAQIETFLAVARTESFTKAGPLVHLSQSAVSRQIQDLEKALGVRLFDRFGGRVSLTPAGRILREEAPKLLRQVENVRNRLRDIGQGDVGDVRIGVTVSVANTFLPRVLSRYRSANRSVALSLFLGHTDVLLDRLRKNEIDVAVVGSKVDEPDLEVCFRIRDELVLIAAPDHPLAKKKLLSPRDLHGTDFIFREPGSDSRALVERWLDRHGAQVKTLMAVT